MKHLLKLLFILPFVLLCSCNNDDDIAQVDLTLTLDNVSLVNNSFYVVEGDQITIQDLFVKSLNGKDATISNVTFYFDGFPLLGQPGMPFDYTIDTENLEEGIHSLSITGLILEVDKSITNVACSFPVVVVDDIENLPDDAPEIGSYSRTLRLDAGK